MKYLTLLFLLISSSAFAANICYQDSSGNSVIDVSGTKQLGSGYSVVTCAVQAPPTEDQIAAQQQQQLILQDEQALAIADLQQQGLLTADQASAQTSNLTALSAAQATATAREAKTTGTTTVSH